jgi:hypothetical protein
MGTLNGAGLLAAGVEGNEFVPMRMEDVESGSTEIAEDCDWPEDIAFPDMDTLFEAETTMAVDDEVEMVLLLMTNPEVAERAIAGRVMSTKTFPTTSTSLIPILSPALNPAFDMPQT